MAETSKHEVVMIGAGPSSLAAAVYTTREKLDTVILEKGVIGGLAAITDVIDNYPGFPQGVSGQKLADDLQAQAERFGAKIELDEVTGIDKHGAEIIVHGYSTDYHAKAVLVATGSDYKKIGVPGEKEFYARGVHYCATCDGAFYQDKRLVVIGGGNSAAQETLFLTRFASHIDILVRSDWRASDVLIDEIEAHQKITVHKQTTTDAILGDANGVTKVIGTNKTTGTKQEFATDGVFVFVGLLPNTGFLAGSDIALDGRGLIQTDDNLMTNIPGIFASGDVRSGATLQIASAVGEGATAALKIREYLEQK
jgi:thioredoxin reductase (NADPH)